MNNFSYQSQILQEVANAPLVEKVVTDENNYTIFQGYPADRQLQKCCIKKIVYTKNGNSELWVTTFAEGTKEQRFPWSSRGTLDYEFYK